MGHLSIAYDYWIEITIYGWVFITYNETTEEWLAPEIVNSFDLIGDGIELLNLIKKDKV